MRGEQGDIRMTEDRVCWAMFALSLVVAYLGSNASSYRVPLDYDAIASKSIPFAIGWGLIAALAIWRYMKRGLWLLVGAPIALSWPVWLLFHRFPPCYYFHNCV
jgi:hypothetical protein